jgi:uncharacterized protein (TIGR03083 family)
MSESTRVLAMFEPVWTSIDELLSSMTDDDWATQSLCPDWSCREVIAHLAGVEHMLAQWMPESIEDPLSFKLAMEYLQSAASMSNDELAADYRRLIGLRREQIGCLTDGDLAQPSQTPVGPFTYGRFMDVRVFDFWVHERDIRIPLARPAASDDGPAAKRSVDEVALSVGYIVGKKIGLADGKSIAFDLTGPVERRLYAAVDGRAKAVERLDDPSVTLQTDSTTFVMLACGRIDPEEQISSGAVRWTGDDEIGAHAARNLAFTM